MNRLPFWLQVLKGRMPQSPFLVFHPHPPLAHTVSRGGAVLAQLVAKDLETVVAGDKAFGEGIEQIQ